VSGAEEQVQGRRGTPRGGVQGIVRAWDLGGMAVLYVCLFAACAIWIPNFLSASNLAGLGQSVITVGIVACGMLFCLASGDFDLSVGSVAACSAVVAVMVINRMTGDPSNMSAWPMVAGITAGLLAGAGFGLVNGVVIAKLRINALITTLATMQIARGMAFIASKHQSVGSLNVPFNKAFGTRTFLSLPVPIWVLIGCILACGFLLHMTVFGRKTLAIGGNVTAARYAGINVTQTKILIFVLQGLLAALAGIVDASQLQNADPKTYTDLALAAISACVLGGVSLTGGVGTILAVVVGTLIMGTVQNAMNARNVDPDYQYLITGGILLATALYDRLKQRVMARG
jgi:L-arabinose transport system permease protein